MQILHLGKPAARHILVLTALLCALFLVACTGTVEENASPALGATSTAPVPEDRDPLDEVGLHLYRTSGCIGCHTLGATGSSATVGPPHDGIGRSAARRIEEPGYTGNATTAEEYIYESIMSPGIFVVGGYSNLMPTYDTLPEEEIRSLVQMLLQQ